MVSKKREEAYFAGGCFWCMESDFEDLQGVINVISGYSGGAEENPNYKDYSKKGYTEAIKVIYNPEKISYGQLLEHFWVHIDPLDKGGQFCDRGNSYISIIFFNSKKEKELANYSLKKVNEVLGKKIATKIIKFKNFYEAEDYHQNYHKKHPIKYNYYRFTCGRNKRVAEIWGDKQLDLKWKIKK